MALNFQHKLSTNPTFREVKREILMLSKSFSLSISFFPDLFIFFNIHLQKKRLLQLARCLDVVKMRLYWSFAFEDSFVVTHRIYDFEVNNCGFCFIFANSEETIKKHFPSFTSYTIYEITDHAFSCVCVWGDICHSYHYAVLR